MIFSTRLVLQEAIPVSPSELGELSISLCHNPTDQKLTVKLNCARALQPITKDGRLSKYFFMQRILWMRSALTWCKRHSGRKPIESKSTKEQGNNENNRLVRRCFFVTCSVSSTPRRSPQIWERKCIRVRQLGRSSYVLTFLGKQ